MSDGLDWAPGDAFGLPIPAHAAALAQGGADWLTQAFRAAGTLAPEERVARIAEIADCPGGGTGAKLFLTVEFAPPRPDLPEELFVKFSRAFGNAIRDRQKIQMEGEVWLALLSRIPQFPVPVPRCLFGDYHRDSGTGVLITERVRFGENGVEPNYVKCLDRDLPDPLGHYTALVEALARLAGVCHTGLFPDETMRQLAGHSGALGVSQREPYSAEQIARRVERYRAFAARYPRLVPAAVRDAEFLDRFAADAPRFCGHEAAIQRFLARDPRFVALGHWNANTDNAWFWREADGRLRCGLFDWGNATTMNVAVALAGCFYGAEPDFLVANLGALLDAFAREFAAVCGITLSRSELEHHLALQMASSGLMWMIDAPKLIEMRVPDLDQVPDWYDPRVFDDELVRTQIHMSAVWLTLWRTLDFGAHLDRFLEQERLQPS